MARRNDNSPYVSQWSTAKLMRELNRTANLSDFVWQVGWKEQPPKIAEDIREATRLYRKSWMQPIINELAKRLKVEL